METFAALVTDIFAEHAPATTAELEASLPGILKMLTRLPQDAHTTFATKTRTSGLFLEHLASLQTSVAELESCKQLLGWLRCWRALTAHKPEENTTTTTTTATATASNSATEEVTALLDLCDALYTQIRQLESKQVAFDDDIYVYSRILLENACYCVVHLCAHQSTLRTVAWSRYNMLWLEEHHDEELFSALCCLLYNCVCGSSKRLGALSDSAKQAGLNAMILAETELSLTDLTVNHPNKQERLNGDRQVYALPDDSSESFQWVLMLLNGVFLHGDIEPFCLANTSSTQLLFVAHALSETVTGYVAGFGTDAKAAGAQTQALSLNTIAVLANIKDRMDALTAGKWNELLPKPDQKTATTTKTKTKTEAEAEAAAEVKVETAQGQGATTKKTTEVVTGTFADPLSEQVLKELYDVLSAFQLVVGAVNEMLVGWLHYHNVVEADISDTLLEGCVSNNLFSMMSAVFVMCSHPSFFNETPAKDKKKDSEYKTPFALKTYMLQLLCSATYGAEKIPYQAMCGELGLLPAVLNSTAPDKNNPWSREWSVFAIKNLTEHSTVNQAYLSKLSLQEVSNLDQLKKMGVQAHFDQASGKVKLTSAKPPPGERKQSQDQRKTAEAIELVGGDGDIELAAAAATAAEEGVELDDATIETMSREANFGFYM